MTDINPASRMTISRDMASNLLNSSQARYLVDDILADGKVNTDSKAGTNDEAGLGKLRELLERGRNNGTLNTAESALLSALDARGWTGTDADVVLRNLQRIQNLQKQVADNNLDPNQVSFDLETQSYTQRLLGGHDTVTVGVEAAAPTPATKPETATTPASESTGEVCTVDESLTAGALSELSFLADSDVNSSEEMARQRLISPTRTAQNDAVRQLQHEAGSLTARLKDSTQVSSDKLQADLLHLHEAVGSDSTHVSKVLNSIGLSQAELTSRNIIDPESSAGDNEGRLRDFLNGPDFKAFLADSQTGPAAIENYRGLLTKTLDAYVQQPSQGNFSELRSLVYDHSYVFESPEGVGQDAFNEYKQLKQTILGVSQQTNLLEKVSNPDNLPASMSQLSGNLQRATDDAAEDIQAAATRLNEMVQQLESQPELFPAVQTGPLRERLQELVTVDTQGKVTGLKDNPPTQASLTSLNAVWAEVEELGLKAGLGEDFDTKGALGQALQRAAAQPGAEADPAMQILKQAPGLAEHADLLAQLSQPENRALLYAVLNNNGENVSKYFGEYNSRFFDFSSMLNGLRSSTAASAAAGALTGSVLGPMGTLIGGAAGAGLSYTFKQWSTDQSRGGAQTSLASRLNLDKLADLSNLGNLAERLSTARATTPINLSNQTILAGANANTAIATGKNMQLAGVNQTQVEGLMRILEQHPEARALLQAQGGNLNSLLEQSPVAGEVRSSLAAKKAFDTAFWSQGSQLEEAQASVQSSLAARSNARISLDQASLAIQGALENKQLDPDARALLNSQARQIEEATKALDNGGAMPTTGADLDKTLAAVRRSHLEAGVTATEAVSQEVQRHLNTSRSEPVLQELETAASDGRLQKLLDSLPAEQATSLRELMSSGGNKTTLNAQEFNANIREILNSPNISPQYARHLTGHLQAISGLLAKANEPGMTPEKLAEFGEKVLDRKSPVPSSSFDVLDDMNMMQTYIRDMKSSLGENGYQQAAQRFASETREIFGELMRPGQKLDRKELRSRMDTALNNIKDEAFNNSLIAGLRGANSASPVAHAEEGPSQEDRLSQAMTANPAVQGALQTIMNQVGVNLSHRADIKPLLERLNRQDQGMLEQIQGLLSEGSRDPAALSGQIQALLGQRMSPQDSQKLQQAMMSELNTQIGLAVRHAEQNQGDYARSGTQRLQGEVLNALKAYQNLLQSGQEVNQAEQELRTSPLDLAKTMGANAATLLQQPGMLPEGITTTNVFAKIFPTLMTNNGRASEVQMLNDLTSFLKKSQDQLSTELGVTINTEQFLAMRLAASSLATTRAVQDPTLGPVAASLSVIMKNIIESPESLNDPGQRAMLEEILDKAANIADPNSRNNFLETVKTLSPEAGQEGQALATQLDANKAVLSQAANITGGNVFSANTFQSGEQPLTSPINQNASDASLAGSQNGVQADTTRANNSAESAVSSSGAESLQAGITSFAQNAGVKLPGQALAQTAGQTSGQTPDEALDREASPIQITASPKAEADEAWSKTFKAVVESQREFYTSYAGMSTQEREDFTQRAKLKEYVNSELDSFQTFVQQSQTRRTAFQRMKDRYLQRQVEFNQMVQIVETMMKSNPNSISDALDQLREKLTPAFMKANAERLSLQATEAADTLMPQDRRPVSNEKQLEELQKMIQQIDKLNPEGRQLVLTQLAEKMISNAIHAFYTERERQNNSHHLQRLEQLSDEFRAQMTDQITQSLARQAGSAQSIAATSGTGSAEISEALNQNLRAKLDDLLQAAQQLRPSPMTDFKRNQILSTLFDEQRNNDLQGLLAIAGTRRE